MSVSNGYANRGTDVQYVTSFTVLIGNSNICVDVRTTVTLMASNSA